MIHFLSSQTNQDSIPIHVISLKDYPDWQEQQTDFHQKWIKALDFEPSIGKIEIVPDEKGGISFGILITSSQPSLWEFAGLPSSLPPGCYHFFSLSNHDTAYKAALAWGLGSYTFQRYKRSPLKARSPVLKWPLENKKEEILNLLESINMVRDLITTPACDMTPQHLAAQASQLAQTYQASINIIKGKDLLKHYPAVYAVGKASVHDPRLIDFTWGSEDAPKVTLVGKGVCFDSGGLNIKPSSSMLLMKKDMAGAAHVLGLAKMIMEAGLKIRLRVLIPAVENSISGNAIRPLDIITMRQGITVEVIDTDAEGRLILADCLTEACTEDPDLIIDLATLTGAARVAMGTEVPAFFCNDKALAKDIEMWADLVEDPLWALPLWHSYNHHLKSTVADLRSLGTSAYGGAIIAALFLEHFIKGSIPWVHIDMMAWNLNSRPGRPEGGEAQGIRALYNLLAARYS